MASRDSKKRPSTTEAGGAEKRSKFDPRNIAAPPAPARANMARRSVKQIPSEASASTAKSSVASSSSAGPGNKTIITTDESEVDEVFECALEVNAKEAVGMAASARQKKGQMKPCLRR